MFVGLRIFSMYCNMNTCMCVRISTYVFRGEDFYPGVNSLLQDSGQVSQAAIDRMTGDLEKQ